MHVTLIAAITIDGFIARNSLDRSFDWTSPEDKQFYVSKLKSSDAIVMGSRSFSTFSRYPKNSDWYIYSRQQEAFINPSPHVITAQAVSEHPTELIQKLKAAGKQQVLICGGASIYRQFVEADLVDTMFLTVEAITFGQGVSLFDQPVEKSWQLVEAKQLSAQTLLLEYQKK